MYVVLGMELGALSTAGSTGPLSYPSLVFYFTHEISVLTEVSNAFLSSELTFVLNTVVVPSQQFLALFLPNVGLTSSSVPLCP